MPNAQPLTVAIVDDDADIRDALQWILNNSEGFACTGVFKNCGEAVAGLASAQALPDVVLMDISMPGQSGIECVKLLKESYPNLPVVMQTVHGSDDLIFESLRAGACGYILKKTPADRLLQAIRDAHEGGAPMSGEVARKVLDFFQKPQPDPAIATLSERELDVLRLLIDGHSYKAIADRLFLSVHTVRFHLHNIYEKLHVSSRMEAVAKAMKHKWF
ncbi:MAG: response regulator transcription factor [Bacteroidota bacterium]